MLDWLEIILSAIIFLTPVWVFLWAIDEKVRPLLKQIRHILLYILFVEGACFLYTLLIMVVFYFFKLSVFNDIVFSTYMFLLLLMIVTAFITAIWWAFYFVGTYSKGKTNEI